MGRHSIPDPDEADDRTGDGPDAGYGSEPAGDSDAGFRDSSYGTDEYGPDEYRSDDYRSDEYGPDDYQYEVDRGYDEPDPAPRGFPAVADEDSPTQAFSVTGRQRTYEDGEWTGSHRAVTTGRRKVSPVVIGALITVVVVVGAVILWRFFGDALSNRSQASADRCVEGEVTVAVIADPAIAEQVGTFAEQYSATADPVGDRCVQVAVKAADSTAVINGFAESWPGELGDRPALWIPASSISEARLETASGGKTVIDSRPLVSSPVVLAVRPELKDALGQQSWSALPGLQSDPAGLDGLNLPGWGGLKLALPLADNSDAAYLAAEAVAAASAP
ncbi:substrate-binding domain-containing protein, partial [Mycobacterium frederiksbergense]